MNIKVKRILVRIFDKSIKTGWFFRLMVVLSALYGLFFTLFNGGVLFLRNYLTEYLSQTSVPDTLFFYKENLLFFVTANRVMYLICFAAGIFILYGCHLLFRGYKWGLFFYTVAKIFQVITPVVFLGWRAFAVGDVMIILFFLVFYYYYSFTHNIEKALRKYNQIKPQDEN
ncbi:MAG: hypothetical protein IJ759_04925 [Bacteroidales bacterium]|nr:hypothetical protein [Bacteroidales bacterium]